MSKSEPARVSYIITTRNRAAFLKETLENVREFITPADELLVMDGGSTDDTASVVASNSDIVTLFQSEPDRGEAQGFNRGTLASTGRFIMSLTDDDYIYPNEMPQALSVLEEHSEIDALLCGGECYRYDSAARAERFKRFDHIPTPERAEAGSDHVFARRIICGLGLLLTRKVISVVGLYDTGFRFIDADYLSRLRMSRVDFRFLNVRLYRHVTYPHSGLVIHGDEHNRDLLRIHLRTGAWTEMMRFPADEVAELLGLGSLPNGPALMQWICLGERLRQSRLHHLLRLSDGILDVVQRVTRSRERVLGRAPRDAINPPPLPLDLEEAHWDGSLVSLRPEEAPRRRGLGRSPASDSSTQSTARLQRSEFHVEESAGETSATD